MDICDQYMVGERKSENMINMLKIYLMFHSMLLICSLQAEKNYSGVQRRRLVGRKLLLGRQVILNLFFFWNSFFIKHQPLPVCLAWGTGSGWKKLERSPPEGTVASECSQGSPWIPASALSCSKSRQMPQYRLAQPIPWGLADIGSTPNPGTGGSHTIPKGASWAMLPLSIQSGPYYWFPR